MILWIVIGILLLSGVIIMGVRSISGRHLHSAVASCSNTKVAHVVAIENNKMTPPHTVAVQCDTLTIVNTDNATRLIAFGHHDHHQTYDGVTEKQLTKGQSLTVSLNELGEYTFHDHLHDQTTGTFTVTQK